MKKRTPSSSPEWYVRNLPHWQPPNAVLFVTACLDGALPKERVKEIKAERELEIAQLKKENWADYDIKAWLESRHHYYFGKYDDLLDGTDNGPHWLRERAAAEIVQNSLHHFHGQRYKLICYTVMSNHIHVVWYQFDRILWKVMQSFKQYTAKRINTLIGRQGTLWQAESWDRNIRGREELAAKIAYTLQNPVKARLVQHWRDYPHNWLNPEFDHWMPP